MFTCADCPSVIDCSFLSHQQMKSETFTGSTTLNAINSTIPFKWRQTKFIFTIDNLQQLSYYSFTLWTSTKEGNGPVFSSLFRTVKGHTPESSSSEPIIAGAVVGSIVGTIIILVIGRYVYRWHYRRFKCIKSFLTRNIEISTNSFIRLVCNMYTAGNKSKPDGRCQQYEDISPETDTNVYETIEIVM